MKTAHKIRMNPTPEQVEYLKRACGTRRFIYNWGRARWEAEYQAYNLEQETVPEAERTRTSPNAMGLKKQFNAMRATAYPWTYDVTKCVVEGAFDDLEKAYANFFAGRAEYPQYKKKGKSHESFYLSNDKFTLSSQWISIPGGGALHPRSTSHEAGPGQVAAHTGNGQSGRKAALCRRGESKRSHEEAEGAQASLVRVRQNPGGDRLL